MTRINGSAGSAGRAPAGASRFTLRDCGSPRAKSSAIHLSLLAGRGEREPSRRCPREVRRAFRRTVDLVRPLLEGLREFAEGLVEDRAHEEAEGEAAELVVDEEFDLRARPFRAEHPAVLEIVERP